MPAIRRQTLTKADVESAKPRESAYRLWDAKVPGLCLRVLPSGVKTFEAHVARGVSRRLGRFPVLTLEAARTKAIAALANPEAPAKPPKVETFAEFLDERYGPWVKAERKAGAATLASIKATFADSLTKPLSAITAWQIERFKADRLRAGIKPATVNRDLVRIRAALSKAVEWGMLPEHPLRTVKRAKGADDSRTRYLTAVEEKRLREALGALRLKRREHLVPLVLVAMNTGLRRGELFGLRWGDVSLDRAQLTVSAATSKGQIARHVPLNSEALETLVAWKPKGAKADDLVFAGAEGGRLTNVNKSWAHLVDQAKLDDFRFHDLRHHFASRLVMAGVDLNTVRELLGHTDIKMTLRYSHLAPEHKANAVAKLVGARG
ncbi:integrase [Dokdonella fugitiva]|uniref:Integrase n=1 Tax=Dokdonella fugitiva TaxID=328517 RepID=A0A839EW95_9GAMM|nr:site-specific integrase [Dokdonella fugitiva]MBA8888887.1 integrase [Dokdonella fugitiva]